MKMNLEQNHKKVLISIIIVFSLVVSFMIPIDNTSSVPQYLGSAIIQSFAALIAIPFTFYASYLYSKYGVVGLQFAIDHVKTYILPLFALVALFSILLITTKISEVSFSIILLKGVTLTIYLGWSRILMFALIIFSSILLWRIYEHLIEIMNATPSYLMDKIVKLNQIEEKVTLETLKKKYRLTFDLARLSLGDPIYYNELIKIVEDLQASFDRPLLKSDLKIDVKEDMRFAYEVLNQFNVNLVRELEKTGPIIPVDDMSRVVKALSKWCFETFLRHAKKINIQDYLSSEWDLELFKLRELTIQEFYDAIHKLSSIYNKNFYIEVNNGMEEAKQHIEQNKDTSKLLTQIKARLIHEVYSHIEAAIEDTHSYREKLSIISEFNVFKLVLKDPEINEILISELTTGLREINEPLENFIKTVNDLIKQGKETEQNEKLLCEISKPVLSATISLVDYVIFKFESEEERDMLLDQISENFVKPSLDLFRVSKAKAILSDINGQYRFSVECIREATSYFDMRYLFECKTDPHTLKEFLEKEKFGLKEYIRIHTT